MQIEIADGLVYLCPENELDIYCLGRISEKFKQCTRKVSVENDTIPNTVKLIHLSIKEKLFCDALLEWK